MHFFESNLLKMINYSEHAKLGPNKPVPGTRTLFLINHQHLPHLPEQQQQQTKTLPLKQLKILLRAITTLENGTKRTKQLTFNELSLLGRLEPDKMQLVSTVIGKVIKAVLSCSS